MSLIKQLENITVLKHYERYEEFKNDPNYDFEIFALRHFNDLEGNFVTPNYSIEKFSEWVIYIEHRALTTKNKILRSRYNDLLWLHKKEFNTKMLKSGNIRDKCQLAIDDYISLAEINILKRAVDDNLFRNLQSYLFRAWLLAKQIRSSKLDAIAQLMIEIENTINENDKIGMWGFSFEKLVKDSTVTLSKEQEDSIIQRIIGRVSLLDSNEFSAIVHGIKILLDYYKTNILEQEQYLDLLERLSQIKSERPFENQHRCEILIELCHKYGFKERKERAIIAYQKYGEDVLEHMIKFEEKMEITKEMRETILHSTTSEKPENHLLKICYFNLFNKESIKNRLQENKQKYILQDLFRTALTNGDGVTTKTLDSEEDELFHESKLNWQLQSPVLFISISHFINIHNVDSNILKNLLHHDLLYSNFDNTLLSAIKSYFDKNFIAMCYISIPLIERGLRQILFQCDRSIYEANKHNGFENITLSRTLNSLEEYLSEDLIFYLKFVLNEKAGLNIRNNLTHGLMRDLEIGESTALTLLHILMLLKSLVGFDSVSEHSQ